MPSAGVNGTEINYHESGKGFPVLLIHGFTGSLGNWVFQIPVLTPHFRTVSLDLRGHGHSAKPTRAQDYALDLMAEDAVRLLDHLEIDACYVVGHSMGGMVAQQLVIAHPSRVRALALVDSAAEVPAGARTPERMRLVEVARTEGMEAVFEEQLKLNAMADRLRAQPLILEIWRQQFLLTSADAYIHCAQAVSKRMPLLDELPEIRVPTLIVCGSNDDVFLEPSRRIHQRISGSEFVVVEGAGHTPQVERAQEFNRVLVDFLRRVDQQSRQPEATRGAA